MEIDAYPVMLYISRPHGIYHHPMTKKNQKSPSGCCEDGQRKVQCLSTDKTNDIIQQVVDKLNMQCQCNFNAGQITNAGFRCFPESPTAVTFRAEFTETNQSQALQLSDFLKQWVHGALIILVQAQPLKVNNACAVIITSFDEGECEVEATTTVFATASPAPSGSNASLVGGVVGAVVVFTVVAIAVLVALLVFWKRRKKSQAYYEPTVQV